MIIIRSAIISRSMEDCRVSEVGNAWVRYLIACVLADRYQACRYIRRPDERWPVSHTCLETATNNARVLNSSHLPCVRSMKTIDNLRSSSSQAGYAPRTRVPFAICQITIRYTLFAYRNEEMGNYILLSYIVANDRNIWNTRGNLMQWFLTFLVDAFPVTIVTLFTK